MSDEQPDPFGATPTPTPPPRRDNYGLPMFLGAWIGAIAQDLGRTFPGYGFIVFLSAVVLIGLLAGVFNRR